MANTYPLAQESYSKTKLQLKSTVTLIRALMRKTDRICKFYGHDSCTSKHPLAQNNTRSFVNETIISITTMASFTMIIQVFHVHIMLYLC